MFVIWASYPRRIPPTRATTARAQSAGLGTPMRNMSARGNHYIAILIHLDVSGSYLCSVYLHCYAPKYNVYNCNGRVVDGAPRW